MGGRRFLAVAMAAFVGGLVLPASAAAAFHLMKVREVYPGAANDSYVVLQMYASGQNFVYGHSITAYDASGSPITTFSFPGSVSNGQNQATILVADSGYSGGPSPDGTDSALNIPSSGGAVCFESIDCVSWGNFAGALPSPAGSPASPGSVTSGMALHRSIAANCPTYLEAADDTNSSVADFSEQAPNPRSNATAPTEQLCIAPTATIDTRPADPTNSTAATFTYHSTPAGASFQCSLDFAAYSGCDPGGITYPGLAEGGHNFRVRATNANGTGSPATDTWTIDLTPPDAVIAQNPADPSPGNGATFKYQSNENDSTFECSLDGAAFTGCPASGVTYNGLDDGQHTFEVRATDPAGNQGDPVSYTWTVDNSLVDTTPPETTITSTPPNPSDSASASFEYDSSEPDSTFECKLDAGLFAACPATGITYTGLASGAHTFQVRATDASDNTDLTPAGYSFDVVLPTIEPSPEPSPVPSELPTSTQPPPDPPPGSLFAAGVARVRGALVLLRALCRSQQGVRCRGALRLLLRVRTRRGGRSSAVRTVVLGRARYSVPAGRPLRIVRVRLTRRGRLAVRRGGRRGLRARLVGKRVRNRAVTLRATKRRQRRNR